MPASPPHPEPPDSDPWHDAEGVHIRILSRVEQVAEDDKHGALPSRLHHQGQVIGRGPGVVYVRFDQEYHLIAIRPDLVRLLEAPSG